MPGGPVVDGDFDPGDLAAFGLAGGVGGGAGDRHQVSAFDFRAGGGGEIVEVGGVVSVVSVAATVPLERLRLRRPCRPGG